MKPKEKPKLLPCPFCGRKPKVRRWKEKRNVIVAVWCPCPLVPIAYRKNDRITAERIWNTRRKARAR